MKIRSTGRFMPTNMSMIYTIVIFGLLCLRYRLDSGLAMAWPLAHCEYSPRSCLRSFHPKRPRGAENPRGEEEQL